MPKLSHEIYYFRSMPFHCFMGLTYINIVSMGLPP